MKALSNSFPKIRTLEMHTGGEPLRIVIEGYPKILGETILEKRKYCEKKLDHLRKLLMWEPRGHADMYGLIKVAAERPDSDFGVLFMHNAGYSTMCGHATLAIAKAAVDLNWVEAKPLTCMKIDAPCGQISIQVELENKEVLNVSFLNVASFYLGEYEISLDEFGTINYDIAYGGAFYAYIDITQFGMSCSPDYYLDFIRIGKLLKKRISESNHDIKHPCHEDLSFLYGVIFIDKSEKEGIHSRNVCVFADGEVDRSATGSGVSGRAAIHYFKNELVQNEKIEIESITGSTMSVEVVEEVFYHGVSAIIPKVSGTAHYTGTSEFWINEKDEQGGGFLLN